jgi:hypothetical protein
VYIVTQARPSVIAEGPSTSALVRFLLDSFGRGRDSRSGGSFGSVVPFACVCVLDFVVHGTTAESSFFLLSSCLPSVNLRLWIRISTIRFRVSCSFSVGYSPIAMTISEKGGFLRKKDGS